MPFWLTWFLVGLVTAGGAAAVAVNNTNTSTANIGPESSGAYITQVLQKGPQEQ